MTPPPVGTATGPGSPPASPGPTGAVAVGGGTGDRPPPGRGSDGEGTAPASGGPETPARATEVGGPAPTSVPPRAGRPERPSRFPLWLGGVAAAAAGIQALFIQAVSHRHTLPPAGWYTTVQARELVRGAWFVDPVRAASAAHLLVPTALHPPLPTVLLAMADAAGATGPTPHMVFLAIVFVATVVLAGVTIRDLAGERAGILAASVFATFPLLWVNPATVGPETTVIAVTTLLLFAAVRFWARPTLAHAALVGLALGLCTLTRTDLVALVGLVGVPLGLLARAAAMPARLKALALMGTVFLLVVGPWAGRNLALFGHRVVLADEYAPVVAGADCPAGASGPLAGWWSPACLARASGGVRPARDATDAQVRAARRYVRGHPAAAAGSAALRLGRVWNLYRPLQTADLEATAGRPVWVSRLGLWYFYGLVPLAVLGAVMLRRRRLLLFPFVALLVLASVTAALAFGDARFAVEADVALALLGGVALDGVLTRLGRPWSGPGLHSAPRAGSAT